MSENFDERKSPDPTPVPENQPRSDKESDFMDTFQRSVMDVHNTMSAGNTEQAEAAALKLLQMAAEEAERNPTPEILLYQEAIEAEARGNWGLVEEKRRRVLALHEASGNAGLITKARMDLCKHFLLLNKLQPAAEFAREATSAARKSDIKILQKMALENEAICALRRSDYSSAVAAAHAAVVAIDAEPIKDHTRFGARVIRALCLAESGDLDGAERDLVETKAFFVEQEIGGFFAGLHGGAAFWWEATAVVRERRGYHSGAAEAWRTAVEIRRHISTLPQAMGPHSQARLARTLRRLGEALNLAGEAQEAESALAESRYILMEFGLPAC
jgi:tetratricopeptide (TPR) repeat protein